MSKSRGAIKNKKKTVNLIYLFYLFQTVIPKCFRPATLSAAVLRFFLKTTTIQNNIFRSSSSHNLQKVLLPPIPYKAKKKKASQLERR